MKLLEEKVVIREGEHSVIILIIFMNKMKHSANKKMKFKG